MSFLPHAKRLRSSPATRRRDENVRSIISALRANPMLRDEMRDMLDVSLSGINKYIMLLREAGVIELARYVGPTRNSPGEPLYKITTDAERVDDYLRSIANGHASMPPVPPDPTRHIHRMLDDGTPWRTTDTSYIPPPDPALAHFFGMYKRPE